MGGQLQYFVVLSEGVHRSRMGSVKTQLYRDDSYPGQLQCQPLAGDQGLVAVVGG